MSPATKRLVWVLVWWTAIGAFWGYHIGWDRGYRAQTPVALCWNVDSIRIHDTHWDQQQRDTATRTIPAPPCEVTR